MKVLGISALYHDSAAAVAVDGEILAAVQEERLSRKKHDDSFPDRAIESCLKIAGLQACQLDAVVYYDDPSLTLDRYLKNVMALGKDAGRLLNNSCEIFGERLWIHEQIYHSLGLSRKERRPPVYVTRHHISHAASAFYPSPFEEAVILTLDGVGEWETTAVSTGRGEKIELKKVIRYPHSIGMLYSAFTYFCGFKVNSGDYKFMGLAPYGKPVYYDLLMEEIIDVRQDGSYRLNLDYFDYQNGGTMISDRMIKLFGERREPESLLTRREMDIAASVQKVVEEVLVRMAAWAGREYDIPNLVLAGGVALNCVANGKLLREKLFDRIWVQPAAGDAGGALGAALYGTYMLSPRKRRTGVADSQKGSYLGPSFSVEEIRSFLERGGYPYSCLDRKECVEKIADLLGEGKVVGLFQGRMEFGPRALGNRSIIADPTKVEMQSKLNLKIKFRESFRPFAPSVLRARASDYFELEEDSPYMLFVAPVREELRESFELEKELSRSQYDMLPVVGKRRSSIPAVTHVDYSARIQTVKREDNSYYYDIIEAFGRRTGCYLVVNTSFNVRGEPIVCSPEDAYRCFMRTQMDILVLENCILYKEEQPEFADSGNWRDEYELD